MIGLNEVMNNVFVGLCRFMSVDETVLCLSLMQLVEILFTATRYS